MTEAELERLVADTARLFGWRVAHFGAARTARGGWRTPVRYDVRDRRLDAEGADFDAGRVVDVLESSLLGATVVCLVPARTDTRWWQDIATAGEVRFVRGRLRFGGTATGAPFPSAVVVFRPGFSNGFSHTVGVAKPVAKPGVVDA